jgi:hypothetical protein
MVSEAEDRPEFDDTHDGITGSPKHWLETKCHLGKLRGQGTPQKLAGTNSFQQDVTQGWTRIIIGGDTLQNGVNFK